jgi:hypothetical protein
MYKINAGTQTSIKIVDSNGISLNFQLNTKFFLLNSTNDWWMTTFACLKYIWKILKL